MTFLRQALADYLALRRAMGYRLARPEKLLAQFLTYLEERGETRLRTDTALAWATLPAGKAPSWWWRSRLTVVRRFATYLHTIDPATEIPSADLLRARTPRATPYLYTDEDIAALLAATSRLRTAHRAATYRTLLGLLVVTGMRVGEAIALDQRDFGIVGIAAPRRAAREAAVAVARRQGTAQGGRDRPGLPADIEDGAGTLPASQASRRDVSAETRMPPPSSSAACPPVGDVSAETRAASLRVSLF